MQQSRGYFYGPCASAIRGLAQWVCMGELLIILDTSSQDWSRRPVFFKTDLWDSWHHMSLQRLKSLSTLVWSILLLMFVHEKCMAVCLILFTGLHWVWLKLLNSLIRKSVHILLAIEFTNIHKSQPFSIVEYNLAFFYCKFLLSSCRERDICIS